MLDFKNLREMLDRYVGKYYNGTDIIIYRGHKPLFRYQAGYADTKGKRKIDPNALYFLYSCTKPMTCTAAMQLFEKGYFLMMDPVSDYLPEFKNMMVREKDENGNITLVPAKRPITVKHLFTMTSGLNYDLAMPSIKEVIAEKGDSVTTADIVKAIAKNPLEFHPGDEYMYGLSHDVLARLIEVWSGQRFGEYMKEHIFDPCGMENTTFEVSAAVKAKMAPTCITNREKGTFEPTETENGFILGENSQYESGGAGCISCVEDYIKFADAMANGGVAANGNRIISQKAIDMMRTPVVKPPTFNLDKADQGYDYGLGVRTFADHSRGMQMQNIGEFGWDGAAGCFVLIDPEEKLSLFYAQQIKNPYHQPVQERVCNVLYTALSNEKDEIIRK